MSSLSGWGHCSSWEPVFCGLCSLTPKPTKIQPCSQLSPGVSCSLLNTGWFTWIFRSSQYFSDLYHFPSSQFELYPTPLQILHPHLSQAHGDFSEQELPDQDGVSVMMTNIWERTKGRSCQVLSLGIWVRLGLLPTITQSFLWVVKVTADIQKRPCPPFPQGYPNTQHSAVWWRLKSQKCWTQRYPALVQITTDIVCMTNGDTDLEPCAALPRGSLSRETLSPSYVQEDPWSPTMFHRRWPGDAFLSHTVDRNRGYLWILVFKNRKQKGTFSPRRREFLPRKGDRPKGFPSAPCATHHSQLWFLHIPVDTCFLQASHFTSH